MRKRCNNNTGFRIRDPFSLLDINFLHNQLCVISSSTSAEFICSGFKSEHFQNLCCKVVYFWAHCISWFVFTPPAQTGVLQRRAGHRRVFLSEGSHSGPDGQQLLLPVHHRQRSHHLAEWGAFMSGLRFTISPERIYKLHRLLLSL